jgi:hypothetical protein
MGCLLGFNKYKTQSKAVAPNILAIFNPNGKIKPPSIRDLMAEKLMAKKIFVPNKAK